MRLTRVKSRFTRVFPNPCVKSRYVRLTLAELHGTHEPASNYFSTVADMDASVDYDTDCAAVILYVLGVMKGVILPLLQYYKKELPYWLLQYLSKALVKDPATATAYAVPLFYVLYKIHKLNERLMRLLREDYARDVPTRPVSANFCWCTQPFAKFAAKMLLPYVRRTAEYVKDSAAINRILATLVVPAGAILICLDVARLYPSIPLIPCMILIEQHLRRQECPDSIRDLIMACLRLTLHLNFSQFCGKIWRQIVGFATGVGCGAEAANIYLHELLRDAFAAVSTHILLYKRFIDDGFIIWTGSRAAAEEFLTQLNTDFRVSHNFEITWTIERDSAIFLDLNMFKGAGWLRCGLLDSMTYAKAINAYLYIPFNSCVPQSVLRGFIATELRRHLLRCSSASAYYGNLCDFYNRLRARGYPVDFLADCFDRRPSFDSRPALLFSESAAPSAVSGPSVFAVPFSSGADEMLRGMLVDELHQLPAHLLKQRRLIAWKANPKIRNKTSVPGRRASDARYLDSPSPPQR